MMQDLMADALANLLKIKAARDPIQRLQGLIYPWNSSSTDLTDKTDMAVIQSADIDPNHFYVTFKEIIKYHMYNTSNSTAYITIIKKYPRKSYKQTGYGNWQACLARFPASAKHTPLRLSSITSTHAIMDKTVGTILNWGYPDSQNVASPDAGGGICPFVPTFGPAGGCLEIPRQYGAFIQFFPPSPYPSFIQQNAQNLFNQGPALTQINNANLAGMTVYDYNTTDTYKDVDVMGAQKFNTKTAGPSANDPGYLFPSLSSNYYPNLVGPNSTTTNAGDTGNLGYAMSDPNYQATFNADYKSEATNPGNYPGLQRSFISGATYKGADGTDAVVNANAQADPFSTSLGGSGRNWSTHPHYDEMRNKCMRQLFKMYKKRCTIPPGKVLRWTLKSRRATINPHRDNLIPNAKSTTVPAVWSGSENSKKTLDGWGTSVAPSSSVGGNVGQPECPSMWGPEWPCRTVVWSCAIRGQTASRTGTANLAQLMPTEILLKKDHIIKYGVKYSPVSAMLKKHRTVRNFMEYAPDVSNYRIQYPIAGTVAGGAAATADSSALPTTVV